MQAVILVAGQSSRFWPLNKPHKSLIKIMGKPFILHTIESLQKFGIKDIIIVQGKNKKVEEELKKYNVKAKFIIQKEPRGTGNAVWQTRELIKENFIVLGPHKIDLENYLPVILKKSETNSKKIILVGVKTLTPWEYGILKFKGKKIQEIVENPQKGKEPSNIKATETYILTPDFFDIYKKLLEKEDTLIEVINELIKENGAEMVLLKTETASLKYPWQLLNVLKISFESKKFKKQISKSAIIGERTILKGNIFIGDNTKIGDGTIIYGPCYIGKNCQIGTNNLIRGPVVLEDNILTGAFFEIKNSIVQEGSHFHSGFVGDSIVGKNCRFGAGFISANRRIDRNNIKPIIKGEKIDSDLSYLGLTVGDNSKFGINSSTMPGVIIGSNCSVGPSSVVFKNIKDDTNFFTEFKEIIQKKTK